MRMASTEGEGGVGQSLRPWLEARGDKVVSIDLHPVSASVRADVRDTDRLAALFFGCDAVVHSAATLPSSRPEQIRSVDVDGTDSTLQAACRANVPRFVHISSTAVY